MGGAKPLAVPAIDVRIEQDLRGPCARVVQRQTRQVEAVKQISFEVAPREIVGFLGPNGAGKTTSLKMLSGLLYPSGQITLVMGNRNQLLWDIPAIDSFERNRAIYRLERSAYRQTVKELTALLNLDALLDKPVRNLSLGRRRCWEERWRWRGACW